MTFAHLHNHGQFSVLDGQATIADYATAAVADGQPAFALTDHGTLGGIIEGYKACREAGIAFIAGCELFVDPKEVADYPQHLTVLTMDEQGYRDLIRANNIAQRQFHYRPRISMRQLIDEELMRHWVVLSGCFTSIISRWIVAGDGRAKQAAELLAKYAGAFYIELMWHPGNDEWTEQQRMLIRGLKELSRELSIPCVLTNDCHYVSKEREQIHQQFLRSRQVASKGIVFDAQGFYLKSASMMHQIAEKIGVPEAASNIVEVINLCREFRIPELEKRAWHVPKVPRPIAQLKQLCEVYFQADHPKEYQERYERELGVLEKAPIIAQSYLIAYDLVAWCRGQGIMVAGRGSMAGSLISHILGITTEDPIRHRLLFERAVSPARPTIPDFDIDVSSRRRGEVLDYLQKKYAHSAPIVTYGHYGPRGATRSVLRALGWPNPRVDDVCRGMGEEWEFADLSVLTEDVRTVVEGMRGLYFNLSVHPAGVVLADENRPLEREVPLAWVASSQQMATQYDMYALKELGFFKLDILGLNTLDQLEHMARVSGTQSPEEYDDPKVYEVFRRGDTSEIFQLDGWAARRVLKRIPINSFEDIVAVNALKLPGAAGFVDMYREGTTELTDFYPEIEPILAATRGIVLYQEQVMEICCVLAGFDDAEQDDIKEAIKYFHPEVFSKMEERFQQGCPRDHNLIWQAIKGFSGYAFNRAHAVTYAALAYKMAWYKRYHPQAFYAAVFDECDDIPRLLLESYHYGVRWRAADVNTSEYKTILRDGEICLGLGKIRGLGPATAMAIMARRPIKSMEDLAAKQEGSRALSEKQRMMLQQTGTLTSIGINGDKKIMDELYDFNTNLLSQELVEKANDVHKSSISGWLVDMSQREIVKPGYNKGRYMGYVTLGNTKGTFRAIMFPDLWSQFCKEVHGGPALELRGRNSAGGSREPIFLAESFAVVVE